MIVIILAGGLGNQMFEYAAARAMSLRVGTDLVLNTRMGFERDKVYHRVFALDAFNIKYSKNRLLSFDFPYGYVLERISRRIGRHVLCPWYRYIYEGKITIEELRNTVNLSNVIMSGVWVGQEYFSDYVDAIRQDFTVSKQLPPEVLYYEKMILESSIPVVAMGVRIYQEIKDEKLRKESFFYYNGNYFERALAYLKEKIGVFKLLIFTQAEEWVKDNVYIEGIDWEFVHTAQSDATAVYDMHIMSLCHHYILSDSSFYFWSCWLNPSADKIVTIPEKWSNCVSQEWIRL